MVHDDAVAYTLETLSYLNLCSSQSQPVSVVTEVGGTLFKPSEPICVAVRSIQLKQDDRNDQGPNDAGTLLTEEIICCRCSAEKPAVTKV